MCIFLIVVGLQTSQIELDHKMPVARPESSETRVIAHLDLDCFYVQGSTPFPYRLILVQKFCSLILQSLYVINS